MNSEHSVEQPISIKLDNAHLMAIHHQVADSETTVIIIPGRPQTRVGPHRLFVELAREMALHKVSSIRFDHRGWGDSTGERLSYEESWRDIQAVQDYLLQHSPKQKIILLGLCDGATAAILSLNRPLQIDGLLLLNPYLESQRAESQAMLKLHYLPKLKSVSNLLKALKQPSLIPAKVLEFVLHLIRGQQRCSLSITEQAIQNLIQTKVPIMLVLSGDDLTAAQAREQLENWLSPVPANLTLVEAMQADHTFSKPGNKRDLFNRVHDFLIN